MKKSVIFTSAVLFSIISVSSSLSQESATLSRPVFRQVHFDEGKDVEKLQETNKAYPKWYVKWFVVDKIKVLPRGCKLSDIVFNQNESEIAFKGNRGRVKDYNGIGRIENDSLIWIKFELYMQGSPSQAVTPHVGRDGYLVIPARFLEWDQEGFITKIPSFTSELGMETVVNERLYENINVHRVGPLVVRDFFDGKNLDEFDGKDHRIYATCDCYQKNGELLCKKGEVIGYLDWIISSPSNPFAE